MNHVPQPEMHPITTVMIENEHLRAELARKNEVLNIVSVGLAVGAIRSPDVEMLLADGPMRFPLKQLVDAALASHPVTHGDEHDGSRSFH